MTKNYLVKLWGGFNCIKVYLHLDTLKNFMKTFVTNVFMEQGAKVVGLLVQTKFALIIKSRVLILQQQKTELIVCFGNQ